MPIVSIFTPAARHCSISRSYFGEVSKSFSSSVALPLALSAAANVCLISSTVPSLRHSGVIGFFSPREALDLSRDAIQLEAVDLVDVQLARPPRRDGVPA